MTLIDTDFTEEQKNYLQGFAAGSGLTRSLPLAYARVDTFRRTTRPFESRAPST